MQVAKLVLGITSPGSTPLLQGQARYFSDLGYDVYLFSPRSEKTMEFCYSENCKLIPVSIDRNINVLKDIVTLTQLIYKFKKIKPDIVNFGTPKIGLLGMIAAYLLKIPKRIYTCRGLRYDHERGLKRKIIYYSEKFAGILAHKIVCVGHSLKEQAVIDGLFNEKKCVVIAKGSSNGVSFEKFSRQLISSEKIIQKKKELNILSTFNYGFVGRLVDRKGISELYNAFNELYRKHSNIRLVIIGNTYYNQLSDSELVEKIKSHSGIIWIGWQENIALYFAIFDVCVLPSWWEGFGNVYIQAAAMGLPVIGTNGTGCRDAISDGFNSIQVPIKQIKPLRDAMEKYYLDNNLRKQHASNSLIWASNFKQEIIWNGLHELYKSDN